MTAAGPLVSIIVPSYQQGRYIAETLHSILEQDYRPIEVLVMDGGSTDETVDVLKAFTQPELCWWSEPDRGVVDAVNKGFARAKGEIFAIQSSDDAYTPGAVSAAVAALLRDPSFSLVYGDVEYIDENSVVGATTSLPQFDLLAYIGKRLYIPQPAAFFRSSVMKTIGPWREDISYAADAEFFLRIAARYGARKIERVLARYRYHSAQRDKETARVTRDWSRAIQPYADSSDRALRRAARSGVWMVHRHYLAPDRWLMQAGYAWRTVLADPGTLGTVITVHDLFPLAAGVRQAGSKVKRAIRRLRS